MHQRDCVGRIRVLEDSDVLREYLCPARRISFDGFVNYEGRRFGVPYSYAGRDLRQCLTTHEVTWSRYDRYCKDQYAVPEQPEEFPTMPVQSSIQMLKPPEPSTSFEKFNFDKGVKWDD